MTGEEFLRGWAAEVVAAGDQAWYQRFYSLVEVLEMVGEIDIDLARDIGQGIRAGLTARTGHPTWDFYLGSRRHQLGPNRGRAVPPAARAPQLSVRAASGSLPLTLGDGGTNFISIEGNRAWLACSGAGRAPWPEQSMATPRPPGSTADTAPSGTMIRSGLAGPAIGPPSPPFFDVVDNRQRRYRLSHDSSGASASGETRQRWDLRARIDPAPGDDVNWLEFFTEHGPIRVLLRPPVLTAVTIEVLDPAPSELEHHLSAQIHNQVWLHLLDRDRPLEPLGVVPQALVAVGAIDPDHPLVQAMHAVDTALAGAPPSAGLPDALAAALRHDPTSSPWLGVAAVGVPLEIDGSFVTLEALVGHRDRLAVHFLEAPLPF
ncbi:MAG: hypothetical protein M3N98_08360, partial [Actinomycetota bacterium]|nr:hypothetical protein [Actinomycetota bacterium]